MTSCLTKSVLAPIESPLYGKQFCNMEFNLPTSDKYGFFLNGSSNLLISYSETADNVQPHTQRVVKFML